MNNELNEEKIIKILKNNYYTLNYDYNKGKVYCKRYPKCCFDLCIDIKDGMLDGSIINYNIKSRKDIRIIKEALRMLNKDIKKIKKEYLQNENMY